jgi:hypothetical protein
MSSGMRFRNSEYLGRRLVRIFSNYLPEHVHTLHEKKKVIGTAVRTLSITI